MGREIGRYEKSKVASNTDKLLTEVLFHFYFKFFAALLCYETKYVKIQLFQKPLFASSCKCNWKSAPSGFKVFRASSYGKYFFRRESKIGSSLWELRVIEGSRDRG